MAVKKTKYDMLVELLTDWADGGRLDLLLDAIKAVTDALPDAGALNDLAAILEDTGTTIPGTITTLQAAVTAIKAVTDVIPDAGALTALLADITAILADTGELQTDWADGGRLDLLIDAIKAVTDALPDAGALTALIADITAIKAITDVIPDAGALTALIADITAIKAITDVIPDSGALTALLADIASILADTGELQTDWADGGRLDLLIDAIKAVTDALPDAGALTALIADITAIKAITDVIPDSGALTALLADIASILADTGELQTDWADGGRLDLLIDAIKAQTDKIAGKMLFSMDFWSLPQEEVAITDTAADKALPSVTVADLPSTATIVRAIAMFKFRMVENHTYAGANALNGAQEIQVAGSVDAINFVDTQFTLAQDTREGGDVVIGIIDIATTVNANGAYAFHWDMADAQQDGIKFNDIQMGIRILYSV